MRFRGLAKTVFPVMSSMLCLPIAFWMYEYGEIPLLGIILCTPLIFFPSVLLVLGIIFEFLIFIEEKTIKCPKCNKRGGATYCIDKMRKSKNAYIDKFNFITYPSAVEMLQDCFKCSFCNHIWNFLSKEIEHEDQNHKNK